MINNIRITKIENNELIPYDLLLHADPSKESVEDYLHRGI